MVEATGDNTGEQGETGEDKMQAREAEAIGTTKVVGRAGARGDAQDGAGNNRNKPTKVCQIQK